MSSVSTIAGRLDPATRERLLARLAELSAVDHLMRQVGGQRPPDPPRPLADIATQQEVSAP
jgi:hypothetical protein